MKEEYKGKYKVVPFYIETEKLSSEEIVELLDFCVDCGAHANDCIVESDTIAEVSYVNFFQASYVRSFYSYIGVTERVLTWVSDNTESCYGQHAIELNSLEEVKELFAKAYQDTLPKEEEEEVKSEKVKLITVKGLQYEIGKTYQTSQGQAVILIARNTTKTSFIVKCAKRFDLIPVCVELYEIKCELGKVLSPKVDLVDGVFYKVTYGAGITNVLPFTEDYGFISEYDGSNYQDLYKDFKVICKMTEA